MSSNDLRTQQTSGGQQAERQGLTLNIKEKERDGGKERERPEDSIDTAARTRHCPFEMQKPLLPGFLVISGLPWHGRLARVLHKECHIGLRGRHVVSSLSLFYYMYVWEEC